MTDETTTTIDLLRHGETQRSAGYTGQLDVPLATSGWREMNEALQVCKRYDIVITSPLQRCAAFAQQWAEKAGIPVQLETGLQEIHFGEWEGKDAQTLLQHDGDAIRAFWSDPAACTPPGGESMHTFTQRVQDSWEHCQSRITGQRALLVSHAGVMRVLLCQWLGLPLQHLFRLHIPYAGLSRVRIDTVDGRCYPQLVFLNGSGGD